MKCANGTSTGIGINPHAGSTKLVVFFRGGGKCMNYEECIATEGASYVLSGYGPSQFNVEKAVYLPRGPFARANAQNPFRDFNFVYVPYCTGDLHTGNRLTTYYPDDAGQPADGGSQVHHVGVPNVVAFLERVAPTFANATQVVVSGESAGGFGAAWNFSHVASRWARPATDVVLIDDSGPFLTEPYYPRAVLDALDQVYGYSTTVPGCTDCKPDAGGFWPIYRYNALSSPGFRGSLISGKRDTTISTGFAKSPGDANLACTPDGGGPCEFEAGLLALVAGPLADAGYKSYLINSAEHVWLHEAPGTVVSDGVPLTTFLNRQLANDPQWQSVVPP